MKKRTQTPLPPPHLWPSPLADLRRAKANRGLIEYSEKAEAADRRAAHALHLQALASRTSLLHRIGVLS